MNSSFRSVLRYDSPNAPLVRPNLWVAGVALLPALLFAVYFFFSLLSRLFTYNSVVAAIFGLRLFALGGLWFVTFIPLLLGGVYLRRLFEDAEIPAEVKPKTAALAAVAMTMMVLAMGFCYAASGRGWR